jgi:dienelactone hydrolase
MAVHKIFPIICLWFALGASAAPTSAPTTRTTRADFLKLINRPKVPLDAKEEADQDDSTLLHFSYSAEQSQRVPGILVKPKEGGPRPVVIVMHGTNGRKEQQLKFLKRLAGQGFIGVAIDGRYHGERGNMKTYTAAIVAAFTNYDHQPRDYPLYYDNVWDVMRLIDYLSQRPDVDAKRIGLMGFSKGGVETWLAGAVDQRIACVVPCIGMQSFRWEIDHDAWHARMKVLNQSFTQSAESIGVTKPDAAFVQKFFDREIPGSTGEFDGPQMIALICPRPLLIINGGADALTPLPGVEICDEAAKADYHAAGADDNFKQIIEPNTGHSVTPTSYTAAVQWFMQHLDASH